MAAQHQTVEAAYQAPRSIVSNVDDLKTSNPNWCHSRRKTCSRPPAEMKERLGGPIHPTIAKILSTKTFLNFSPGEKFDGSGLALSGKVVTCRGVTKKKYVIHESPEQSSFVTTYSGIVREISSFHLVGDVQRDRGDFRKYEEEERLVYLDMPNRLAKKLGEPEKRIYVPSTQPENWRFNPDSPMLFDEFVLDYSPSTPSRAVFVRAGIESPSYSVVLQDTPVVAKFNEALKGCDAEAAKQADRLLGALLGTAIYAGATKVEAMAEDACWFWRKRGELRSARCLR